MPTPTDALTRRRSPEEIIADCARGLADEMVALGYGEHALIIKLAAGDFERLAALERELREGANGPTAPGSLPTRSIGPRGIYSARSFTEETLE